MSRPRMPIQPIAKDERGTYRFVKNRIVEMLLEEGPFDINRIAVQMIERGWTENEYFQFAQLEFLEIGSRRWESIRGVSAAMTLLGLFVGAFLGVVDILARKEIKS